MSFALFATCWGGAASAHPNHAGHEGASAVKLAEGSTESAGVTGAGRFRFRYDAELSELPAEIADNIGPAHGGFAKTPSGEVYFGLTGTGLIRVSADLREKVVLDASPEVQSGGLHNTTYARVRGLDLLIVPDEADGEVHVVTLDGRATATLGKPKVNAYYAEGAAPYRPTDTALGPGDLLYICDGYGPGKQVVTAKIGSGGAASYGDLHFGGRAESRQTRGKFSTNHGVTPGEDGETLLIADREHQWLQRMKWSGEFVEGIDTEGANPCDIDFVEFDGERLIVVGCLKGPEGSAGVVKLLARSGDRWGVVSTLRPKEDLGLESFQHIHNAAGVVVDGELYVLCYGWNPGCYAVLKQVGD